MKQGGDVSIDVTVTRGDNCAWTATSNDAFITVKSGASVTGTGKAVLTVTANGGATRVGTAMVAGRTVTVTQEAAIAATPAAFLSFQSDLGDIIANGQSGSFTLTGTQFHASVDPAHRVLTFSMPSIATWTLSLASSSGQQLSPGFYDNAVRFPSGSDPSVSFLGNGHDCTVVIGRFLVAESVFGAGDTIERFHAKFEQHCLGASVSLSGEIWIDSGGSASPPPMGSLPPPPASPTTFLTLTSDPGDFVGQGASLTYTLPSTLFWSPLTSGPVVCVIATSPSATYGTPVFHWQLCFSGTSGTRLQPGTYELAQHYPDNPPGSPGLDVQGGVVASNARGCGSVTGRFVVTEAVYGTFGELYRFHATFEQHCSGATPALRGEIYIVANPWR